MSRSRVVAAFGGRSVKVEFLKVAPERSYGQAIEAAWTLDYVTLAAMSAGFVSGVLAGFGVVAWGI